MIYEIQKNNGESFQVRTEAYPNIDSNGIIYFYESTEEGPRASLIYKLAEGDSVVFVCD